MRSYPQATSNQNVPKDAYIIAETSTMSGEIITTYYADKDLNLWKVSDWKGDKPNPAYLFEVCKLTGDFERMVQFRIKEFFGRL